jgi:hypothetical protein
MRLWRLWRLGIRATLATFVGSAFAFGAPVSSEVTRVDLAKPFSTRSAWKLVVTQGPPTADYGDNPAPGALRLCLEKDSSSACAFDLAVLAPRPKGISYIAWEPHYLTATKRLYPQGKSGLPLLLIVTGSLCSGDGDQVIATQLLRYNREKDAFERVYVHSTGKNRNEEVRFVSSGPLQGAVISAEPTDNAPYGYWIEVNRFSTEGSYRQVLRYRSATHYGDGNSLAVIDSEMANIERRLGLWRPAPSSPLPADAFKLCSHPHLKHTELWCT